MRELLTTVTPAQECAHRWKTNSGQGGEPLYRLTDMSPFPLMPVRCTDCGARTWFTRFQWHALPNPGELRSQIRQRQREALKIEQEEINAAKVRQRAQHNHIDTGPARTYWNGERCEARRVVARIGKSPVSTWWCAELEGQEIDAVEITYHGQRFLLDDTGGLGWNKVTAGRGSPQYGHRSLPDDSVVLRERA